MHQRDAGCGVQGTGTGRPSRGSPSWVPTTSSSSPAQVPPCVGLGMPCPRTLLACLARLTANSPRCAAARPLGLLQRISSMRKGQPPDSRMQAPLPGPAACPPGSGTRVAQPSCPASAASEVGCRRRWARLHLEPGGSPPQVAARRRPDRQLPVAQPCHSAGLGHIRYVAACLLLRLHAERKVHMMCQGAGVSCLMMREHPC